MRTFFYTYKIIHNDSNKYYLGKRSYRGATIEDDHLYLGSGNLIRRAVKKYGKSAFTKEIIAEYPNRKLLDEAEAQLITQDVLDDPLCYNLVLGGHGGSRGREMEALIRAICQSPEYRKNMSDIINSPEVKDRMISSIKATMADPEWKKKFSETQKRVQNLPHNVERNRRNQKIAQSRDDVREKKSIAMREKFATDEIMRERHRQAVNSEEMRAARKKFQTGRRKLIKDGEITYVQVSDLDAYFSEGWMRPGQVPSYAYINRDGVCKKIGIDLLDVFLNEGWEKGRLWSRQKDK